MTSTAFRWAQMMAITLYRRLLGNKKATSWSCYFLRISPIRKPRPNTTQTTIANPAFVETVAREELDAAKPIPMSVHESVR